ncbi:CLUMA_CG020061, isoform A [Clunio marinus]|uniref:Cilia- and flagella-associated protein 126 n=1 Tax=Clunio marinus TaxID=568069 RepID=A0A1J1J3R0_9DIPT|nr:CLUMA_CG020061, isoform A [Clunio marinus]
MAANFSANQFEKEFQAKSLCNWEVPHWYPKHPRQREASTRFIANDRGHLLPNVERPKSSPWGRFKTTWQLPRVITKQIAEEIHAPAVGSSRWAMPDPNRAIIRKMKEVEATIKKEKCVKLEVNEEKLPDKMKEIREVPKEVKTETTSKKSFNEKEKLNNPLAIAKQGRRSIRHETLERDNDEH